MLLDNLVDFDAKKVFIDGDLVAEEVGNVERKPIGAQAHTLARLSKSGDHGARYAVRGIKTGDRAVGLIVDEQALSVLAQHRAKGAWASGEALDGF